MDFTVIAGGMVGAFTSVLGLRNEVLPELGALYETESDAKRAEDRENRLTQRRDECDAIRARLEEGVDEPTRASLQTALQSLQAEIKEDDDSLYDDLRHIRRHQLIVRSVGYLLIVVLGGFGAALLQNEIDVDGVSAEVESIIIGANIIAILSGLLARKKSQKVVEAAKGATTADATTKEAGREADRVKDDPHASRADIERLVRKVKRAEEEVDQNARALHRIVPQAQV